MADFDALPADLRRWLAGAHLPFSASSALRLWHSALRESGGDPARALDRLCAVQQRMLRRDAATIWGRGHPGPA